MRIRLLSVYGVCVGTLVGGSREAAASLQPAFGGHPEEQGECSETEECATDRCLSREPPPGILLTDGEGIPILLW
jgi:hypothetical protein